MAGHALICGLGSIGQRHLRHLRALGVGRVDAFRTGMATLAEDPENQPDGVYSDLDEALAEQPQIVVVANPTSLHVPTALAAARAGCHVLIEKPLSDGLDGVDELAGLVRDRGLVASVAFNLRFHPALRLLRSWTCGSGPQGAPLQARAHFGAYLPDWHPWEEFRASYAARRELGGGATLTNVHEIDYCLWLFGAAEQVHGVTLPRGPLGTDVDEASALLLGHASGVISSITLSLVQRPPSRRIDIAFEDGIAACDLLTGVVTRQDPDGKITATPAPKDFDLDNTYRDQAAAFLRAVDGDGPPGASLDDGIAALHVALAAVGQ